MLRRYSVAEYEERVAALRAEVPGVTLSTDVIVGFPGETEEDFLGTLALVERVGFSGLFGFKYSVRPYTPAQKLEGEPSEDEKSERLARLFSVAERERVRNLESVVEKTVSVLVEGRSKGERWTGRSERNEIVHFASSVDPTGQVVPVRIVAAFKNSLSGEADAGWVARFAAEVVVAPEPRTRSLPLHP
jgi:tRNA-2-methylthio-N6-dimethylallyladenosine synthase